MKKETLSTGFPGLDFVLRILKEKEEKQEKKERRNEFLLGLGWLGLGALISAGYMNWNYILNKDYRERWSYLEQLADSNKNGFLEPQERGAMYDSLHFSEKSGFITFVEYPSINELENAIDSYESNSCF